MAITWRDGITTLAAATAVLVGQAYFHEWGWPLVHELSWAIAIVAALGFVIFYFSFAMDDNQGVGWSAMAYVSSLLAAGLAAGGVLTESAIFLVLAMIVVVLFWLVSVVRHVFLPSPPHNQRAVAG